MPDYTTYKAERIVLMDEVFVDYCKGNNRGAVKFWEDLLTAHPQNVRGSGQCAKNCIN